jgi:hypothetical protein
MVEIEACLLHTRRGEAHQMGTGQRHVQEREERLGQKPRDREKPRPAPRGKQEGLHE